MKTIQLNAIMMMILIIMLPIVTAEQINVQKFSGKANVKGYAGTNDILNAEVTVPGTIAPSQLRIYRGDTYFLFQNCAPEANGDFTKCSYTTPLTGISGTETYTIKLFDTPTSQTPIEEKNQEITIDNIPPAIKKFEATPETTTSGGTTQITYIVDDKAYNPSDATTCSGLKEIKITYGSKTILTEPGDQLCQKENTLTQEFTTTKDYESTDLCIQATDVLGQQSTRTCKKITIDKQAPNIKKVDVSDSTGKITHFRTGGNTQANIVIEIDGDDVDFDNLQADLTKLDTSWGTKKPDTKLNNQYIWENIVINNPRDCEVTVTASDLLGNTATKTLNCNLKIDDTAPTAKSITTGKDEQIIGKYGTITAEIEEKDSGMNKTNAYLDLSQIGMSSHERADQCTKEGNNWKCTWEINAINQGTKTITLLTDTTDDAGNRLSSTLRQEITVDTEPPTIQNTTLTLQRNTATVSQPALMGDTAEFYVNVSGANRGTANFTDLSLAEEAEGECTEKQCKFTTVIQNSGPYTAEIIFTIYDTAGNTATTTQTLQVLESLTDQKPNYWKIDKTQCSPQMIDRQTASLYPHPVYCAIHLKPANTQTNATPLNVLLRDPTLCAGDTPEYVSNVELKNAENSKTPIIQLTLEPANIEVNSINISCPIQIYTRINDKATTVPEEETTKFNLTFYNLPFGELNKNVNDEIEDAIKTTQGMWKTIGTIEKFIGYAGKICSIKSIISSIISTLDQVLLAMDMTATAIEPIPGAQGASEQLDTVRKQLCGTTKGPIEQWLMGEGNTKTAFDFLDNFCNFVDCRLTTKEKTDNSWIRNTAASISGGIGTNWCGNIKQLLEFGGGEYGTLSLNAPTQPTAENPTPEQPEPITGWENAPNLFGNLDVDSTKSDLSIDSTVNVKDSLIWSTACLCVPGIVYNLNKLRQINCRYATCMMTDVKQKGLPKSYCSDLKHYQTCTFVVGEIFSILPITGFLDKVYTILTDILSNPFAAVATVAGCLCGGCPTLPGIGAITDWCEAPHGGAQYWGCIIPKTLSKIADATTSIMQMAKTTKPDYWKTNNNWCEQMEDAQKREGRTQQNEE